MILLDEAFDLSNVRGFPFPSPQGENEARNPQSCCRDLPFDRAGSIFEDLNRIQTFCEEWEAFSSRWSQIQKKTKR
ncbi:MAG: hypothetical protein CMO55_04610 [Verrucomicrobiales bacterium]|nr:hypothetical protein [Verrucomicrobiales bacterium]